MDTLSFIRDLRAAGAILIPAGDRLRCEGPEDVITDEVVERLREQKKDILEALERERQAVINEVPAGPPGGRLLADSQSAVKVQSNEDERQAVIHAVIEPTPGWRLYNDDEFNERLKMVKRAFDAGVIDEPTRAGLLGYLWRSWKPSGEPKGKRHVPVHVEEKPLPSPGRCESCPAAVLWPSTGAGKWCVHYALFEGRSGMPRPCSEAKSSCPLLGQQRQQLQ